MALRTAISSPGGDFKVSYFLFRSCFLMLPERSEDLHELIPSVTVPVWSCWTTGDEIMRRCHAVMKS